MVKMPNSNFIQIKQLEGDLLVSLRQHQLGCTLTTKEIILQKPHVTYHIFLADILGIIPSSTKRQPLHLEWFQEMGIHPSFRNPCYRITVKKLCLINRSGRYDKYGTDLLIPLPDRFIQHIRDKTDLISIPTHMNHP